MSPVLQEIKEDPSEEILEQTQYLEQPKLQE